MIDWLISWLIDWLIDWCLMLYQQCFSHLMALILNSSFCVSRESMPSHFKFKEYCPIVFRNLRERFGIDDQDYMVTARVSLFIVWNICTLSLLSTPPPPLNILPPPLPQNMWKKVMLNHTTEQNSTQGKYIDAGTQISHTIISLQ